MTGLPVFYPDNVSLMVSDTLIIRGNTVSDISGSTAVGIKIENVTNLRAKNNKVVRIRSPLSQAKGFEINNVLDVGLIYNVASRTNLGFDFGTITNLYSYNMTTHLCDRGAKVAGTGTFRNIAFSAYPGNDLYHKATGFYAPTGSIDVDYVLYYGLASLVEIAAASVLGDNIYEKQLLYIDEVNDDLTPDYISEAVGIGTANPLSDVDIDIGGIEGPVTNEETADKRYWYNLIDNTFWDVQNPQAAEVTFIKALQSRILASVQVETTKVKSDIYIKFAESLGRFSELYPMYARYTNSERFKKMVIDMWYAGQNGGTLQAYQNGIGGYNRLPSFFRRMDDYQDGWIIGASYIDYDNWLNSMEDLKYGIGVDMLGTSTLNQSASGECYTNVQGTVSDISPVRWFLHNEVQPQEYLMFADGWNGFEQCTLENMYYNDTFGISPYVLGEQSAFTTPLLSTGTETVSGGIPTISILPSGGGYVELSLLDRTYSEDIDRHIYYRQGSSLGTMSVWAELPNVIGTYFFVDKGLIQFRVTVDNLVHIDDYEFVGLCLRRYYSDLDWTRPNEAEEDEMSAFFHLLPGAAMLDVGKEPDLDISGLQYPADGFEHKAGWTIYIPASWRTGKSLIERLVFGASTAGTAKLVVGLLTFNESSAATMSVTFLSKDAVVTAAPDLMAVVDVDITPYINSSTTHVMIGIARDSSTVGDTLDGDLTFLNGYKVE